jgi:DedD protein
MPDMEDSDVQQHLKKRARRRLVGAVFFVSLVAVLLPTLMDSEPRPPMQDVDIRIPGQDDKTLAPLLVPPAEPVAADKPAVARREAPPAPEKPPEPPAQKPADSAPAKAEPKPEPKPQPKPEPKPEKKPAPAKEAPAKEAAKEAAKAPKEAPPKMDEASRAAAILAGKSPDAPAAAAGQHVILIGAFSNEANVANLRKKLGEQGIKVYTEALDSPQGKKTRVRAGPFPNREAAEKALQKMQRIGVSGVVAAQP